MTFNEFKSSKNIKILKEFKKEEILIFSDKKS